ncbi:MAG: DinB family protein [Planctomycetota bacterium]
MPYSPEVHALADTLKKAREQTLALCADLTESQMTRQPECELALNHPAWVLGHLFMLDAYAADLLGMHLPTPVDDAWAQRFGPTSTPAEESELGGSQLREQMAIVRERLIGRIEALADAEAGPGLDAQTPDEAFRKDFPTLRHLVQYLLWHEAYHSGQLSAWRRAMGLPKVGVAFLAAPA